MTAVVIGYGNTLRGDDGAGPAAAVDVTALGLPGVRALTVLQLTPELAELLAESSLAVFVDASVDAEQVVVEPVQPGQEAETLGHTSDPKAILALAWAVYGTCPPAWLVRIPTSSLELGVGLSPQARRGVAEAVREVVRLLARSEITHSPPSSPVGSPPADACQ